YVENINYNGKNISVIGEDPETTIIDGNGTGSVVEIGVNANNSVLSNFTVQNGTETGTTHGWGSGIYAQGNIILDNLIVKNNTNSSAQGAGIFLDGASNPTIKNCLIINNTGDGIVCHGSNSLIDNVTIINNSLAGIYLRSAGSTVFPHPTIVNSIIHGNLDNNQIHFGSSGSIVDISYCLVEEGQDGIAFTVNHTLNWGSGNIDVDPMFVDTTNGNYQLLATSQLINAGHPDSTDSDGSRADIGAYPYLNTYSGPTWYVSATDGNDTTATGASAAPFKSIQSAINFATTTGDSVTVAVGTYVENIDFRGRNIKVVGADRETTIIDGNQAGSVVLFNNNENNNAYLKSFTIRNGYGLDLDNNGEIRGGGIYIVEASPTLENLILLNNYGYRGSGIYASNVTSVFKNLIFTNNFTTGRGAFSGVGNNLVLENLLFYGNNNTDSNGNTIDLEGDSYVFKNCTIANNKGRPVYTPYQAPNVIFYNSIIDYPDNGGLPMQFNPQGNNSSYYFINCQVRGGIDSSSMFFPDSNYEMILYTENIITSDPAFVDTANGDYHLSDLSPAIGAGTASITIDNVTYTDPGNDLDGNPRPNPAGTLPDMGAYESDKGVDPNYAGPVWYVDGPAGLPYGNGGPGAPFTTIAAGISASSSGDTVSVKAGTYVENINFNGKNIALLGENRETTIIDGDSSGSVVTFSNGETPSAVLDGFTLTNGEANDGGGIFVDGTDPTLTNLIINNNTAVNNGGGIYISNSSLLLKNSIIRGNSSVWGGGIQITNNSVPTILNVEITGNNIDNGQAVWVAGSDPIISNTTITNNESSNDNNEKGIDLYHGANVTLTNSIITGQNYAPINFSGGDSSSITISYSLIEGGQDSIVTNDNGTVTWGSGNIDVDPMFVDTANGNYHLLASSHLINAGHPDSTDSDGTRADIGAYPYLNTYSGPMWYVSGNGNDTTATGGGTDSFRSIQAAINFASDGHNVNVASGNYFENINFRGRAITVTGSGGSTIDGGGNGTVVTFDSGEDSTTTLSGFTIQNGLDTAMTWPAGHGGGIFISDASPNLTNLTITNNQASFGSGGYFFAYGGVMDGVTFHGNTGTGLELQNSTGTMKNSVISSNTDGGIIIVTGDNWTDPSYMVINNSQIINNTTTGNGGGIYSEQTPVYFTGGSISGNTAVNGAGIYFQNSDAILDNVKIYNNTASNHGGGVLQSTGTNLGVNADQVTYKNVIIASNNAVYGTELFLSWGTKSVFTNSIIYKDTLYNQNNRLIDTNPGTNISLLHSVIWSNSGMIMNINGGGDEGSAPVFSASYSNISNGQDGISSTIDFNEFATWGSGNIDVDPMFVDTANGNYNLLASSQLINAGHPDSTDSDGSRADIGAYPYLNTFSGPTWYVSAAAGNDTTSTGASTAPFKSIQSAINFATTTGDSVTVAAGIYVENIDFRGRNIKVVGEDRETTIIDGNQAGSVVLFKSGESNLALLSGFIIT
ncbi:uncharacterized protein METZ01_LOCUS133269, partial [marine metagenome]